MIQIPLQKIKLWNGRGLSRDAWWHVDELRRGEAAVLPLARFRLRMPDYIARHIFVSHVVHIRVPRKNLTYLGRIEHWMMASRIPGSFNHRRGRGAVALSICPGISSRVARTIELFRNPKVPT